MLIKRWAFMPVWNAEGGDGGGGVAEAAPVETAAAEDTAQTALVGALTAEEETKTEAGAEVEAGGDKAEEEAEAEATPFEVAIPDGMDGHTEAFKGYEVAVNGFLKDNPNATARDALAWAAEYQAGQVETAGKALLGQFNDQVTAWEGEARKDSEIGGANYDASVKHAVTALRKFGTPELTNALHISGLGSHPEVIRAFAKIGKAIGESVILSGEGQKGETSFAQSVYGKRG